MGKRRKRLTMAKYAKKYASVRATIAKLKDVVEDAMEDGVVTAAEAKVIENVEQDALIVKRYLPPWNQKRRLLLRSHYSQSLSLNQSQSRRKRQLQNVNQLKQLLPNKVLRIKQALPTNYIDRRPYECPYQL